MEGIHVVPEGFESLACSYALPAAVSGARPSYPDGTFREWLDHLCGRDSIEISNLREFYGDGRQPAEGADRIMRNLYAVCAMSMEPYFADIARSLFLMTESFRVPNVSGLTVELVPAGEFLVRIRPRRRHLARPWRVERRRIHPNRRSPSDGTSMANPCSATASTSRDPCRMNPPYS